MNPPSSASTMRAIGFTEFGGPGVLQILNLALPHPAADEVLVRVAASTVNPSDTMMRAGQQAALMTHLTPPYVAGMEFSGTVQRLGSKVTGLSVGQRVMGAVNPRRATGGAHAEFITVPVGSLAALGPEVELVPAATVPMNGLTASMVLDALALQPNQSVLITGAAGAVGGYVIQLARQAGLQVLADATESDKEWLKSLGADILVPRGDTMADAVHQHFLHGVDALVDCALLGNSAAALVRDGGTAISLRRSNPITDPRLRTSYVSVVEQMQSTAVLTKLAGMLQRGELTPRVSQQLSFEQAALAHQLLEQGGLRGRVVLTF